MNTILDYEDVFNSGIDISTDIRPEVVTFAIETVERVYVAPAFGELYQEMLQSPEEYVNILNGTDATPSLKLALEHMVWAYLIYDTVTSTRFTAVLKESDESSRPDMSRIYKTSSHHWETGALIIRQILQSLNMPTQPISALTTTFGELLWANGDPNLLY